MASLKALDEAPEPGTSSQDKENERQHVSVLTTWSKTRSVEELRKLQKEDSDIGPILEAKVLGDKLSSQEMVTRSPASRYYWILWDSLAVYDDILFKKFIKRDGSGEYLKFIVPSSMKKEIRH